MRGANADTAAEPLFLNAGGPSFGEDLVFNVSLSRTPTASEGDVIVSYETSDTCGSNSATPADDFIPLTGTLTFPPGGSTADEVVVQVYTDGETEADETVCLKLIDITPNADIVDAQGIGTILDDDVLDLFVADTSVTEGDSGTSSTTVQVSAIGSSANDIIVNYELDTYSATEGIDFVDESGSVTIFSSVGYATLDVSIIGDNIDESDEALTVDLLNASGAPVNNLFDGRVTITDNDAVLSVNTSGGTSATEDGTITLTAQLNQTVPNDVTVNWSLTFGSGYTEAISTDVESSSLSGTATIFANTPSTTITIDTEGDSLYEADETFYFDMNTSASNITEGTTSATLTIDDDDTQPTVKIYTSSSCTGGSTTSVGEGDPPDANSATLYVCLIGGTSGENVLVDYDHVPGSADTSDYVEDSGTVTVTAGSTSTTILSAVEADDTYENGGNDETYTVEISNARGASSSIHYSITTNSAEVRITEDD